MICNTWILTKFACSYRHHKNFDMQNDDILVANVMNVWIPEKNDIIRNNQCCLPQ